LETAIRGARRGGQERERGREDVREQDLIHRERRGLGLYLAGSTLWVVPCIALIVFSTLEWALSFCAACWAYGVWYQKFPPKGV
jgi:hypothetical protein